MKGINITKSTVTGFNPADNQTIVADTIAIDNDIIHNAPKQENIAHQRPLNGILQSIQGPLTISQYCSTLIQRHYACVTIGSCIRSPPGNNRYKPILQCNIVIQHSNNYRQLH